MSRDYKSSAREKPASKGSPFLTGLLIGLLLGIAIAVAFTLMIKGTNSPFVSKDTQAPSVEAPNNPEAKDTSKEKTEDTAEKPRFDFYNILPGNDNKAAEQEIKQNASRDEQAKPSQSYYLQVGSFQTEEEADNMKAKLALLGMETIVQTATIPDKGVWHRVRVGPFDNVDQINKAKAELVQNGFSTDLIKMNNQ
jgi:cell division protein FtsN